MATAMTVTYDPHHPAYLDEADVRDELTRVFDVCRSCRRCTHLCSSFPTLFTLIDRFDDRDAGRLTPAEQDQVVEHCSHCKLCAVGCPYVPEMHESAIDFPRLMLRAEAMRHANGHQSFRQRVANQTLARTYLLGTIGAPAGSLRRRVLAVTTGVSAVRLLPPGTKQRFSTWMSTRTAASVHARHGRVTVFATCLVEYHDVPVGRDLVRVYERNGIECALAAAGCCGVPWLDAGDVEHFTAVVDQNVGILADAIRAGGGDIVVPEPTCSYVVKREYPRHCDPRRRADAELVAEHTFDAVEYLMKIHRQDDTRLDTDFTGEVPEQVTYHAACHLRAQGTGTTSRDLLELVGAHVEVVDECAGIGGLWGLRSENEALATSAASQLAAQVEAGRPGAIVAGNCSLANAAIAEQTGVAPSHPLSVLARAYGIPD